MGTSILMSVCLGDVVVAKYCICEKQAIILAIGVFNIYRECENEDDAKAQLKQQFPAAVRPMLYFKQM